MYKCLSPSAIGVKADDLPHGLKMARVGRFQGLEFRAPDVAELIDRQGASAVKKLFTDAALRSAAFGLPVEWRKDEARWRTDLEQLPRLAKSAAAIGVDRTFTWVMPCSNERAMDENRAFHIARFKPVAAILAEHRIHLGLEFIGAKTLRDSQKFPFIYKMFDMLKLAEEIGPNVGLLVDAWHWYTSHGTLDELRRLRPEQVVYVHVNDAPAGIDVDQQIDNVRDLPAATGVIDIAGFLRALKDIGYDGPVTPEPFKKDLADLPDDEARARKVGAAMDDIFGKADLTAALSP